MKLAYIILFSGLVLHALASESAIVVDDQESLVSMEIDDRPTGGRKLTAFKDAIDRTDLGTAFRAFHDGDKELEKSCTEYLITVQPAKLANLLNGAEDHIKEWAFIVILKHASQHQVDDLIHELKPSKAFLKEIAKDADWIILSINLHTSSAKSPKSRRKKTSLEQG